MMRRYTAQGHWPKHGNKMKIAVILPVIRGGSGGFVKHINEITREWNTYKKLSYDVIVPRGILNGLVVDDEHIVYVSRSDCQSKFSETKSLLQDNKYDVVLNAVSRDVDCYLPFVAIIQNIEPIQKPSYKMSLLYRMRLLYLRHEYGRVVGKANRVIAVSDAVKNELLRCYNISSGKIDVIHHGFHIDETTSSVRPSNVDDDPFFFIAGCSAPYRGFEDVIRAVVGIGCKIVIAGSNLDKPSSYDVYIDGLIRELGIQDQIYRVGYLNRSEMNWCYRNCMAFIQTSRAESFANISVEAMANKAVIISVNNQPMPEIIGDAAMYYQAGDYKTLSEKMNSVMIMTDAERSIYKNRSVENSKRYSWKLCAQQTLQSLDKAICEYGKDR